MEKPFLFPDFSHMRVLFGQGGEEGPAAPALLDLAQPLMPRRQHDDGAQAPATHACGL